MLMIAQRLSTVARAHWIILLNEGRVPQSKLPRRNPRAAGCLLAKLHDAKNNEMGSHVGDPVETMGCAIIDIEVTKPLPRLSLNEGQTGFAIDHPAEGQARRILAGRARRQANPGTGRTGPADHRGGGSGPAGGSGAGGSGFAVRRGMPLCHHRHLHQGSSR